MKPYVTPGDVYAPERAERDLGSHRAGQTQKTNEVKVLTMMDRERRQKLNPM